MSIISNPVRKVQHKRPEGVFNISDWAVSLFEINLARLSLELTEYLKELFVHFESLARLKQDIRLVVAIERPVILVEGA